MKLQLKKSPIVGKTFKELTVGDHVFSANGGSSEYKKEHVSSVSGSELKIGYNDLKRSDLSIIKKTGSYHSETIYSTNESQIVRYCKSQLMKDMNSKILDVHNKLKKVQEFKLKNWDLLNNQYTETAIMELEKQVRRL